MEKKKEGAEALEDWDFEDEKFEHEIELDEASRKRWETKVRAEGR